MARLSAAGAPATPDQTDRSEERSSTGAGAMATSNASVNALQRDNASPGIRGTSSNTAHTGAMGQNESRETVRARNNALHRASEKAVAPKSGKLPRRSGGLSHVVSGQRRLGRSVLADADTYNVPTDDDDDDEPGPSRRKAATTAQFSPLKRQIQQQSREERLRQEEQERQAALDRQLDLNWERGNEKLVEDVESWRGAFMAALSGEDPRVHEVSESGASDMQHNAGAEEPEVLIDALDEPVPDLPQQNDHKRKRGPGRPRKSRPNDEEQEQASEPPRKSRTDVEELDQASKPPRKSRPNDEEQEQASEPPRRKRGRPSNAEREAKARRPAAQEVVEASVIHAGPPGMTDELSPTGPPQATRIATSQDRRLQRPTQTTAAGSNTAPLIPSGRPRQASTDQVVPQSGSNSRHQITADDEEEPLFVEIAESDQPDMVRPEELGGLNDEEYNDQTHAADIQLLGEEIDESRESSDDQDSEDDEEDEDEHLDETEIQLEPMANDRHRLYGYWHKIREVMREVAKHRGSTVRIKDEEFKAVIQACKEATTTVSGVVADISPDDLIQTVGQCEDAIAQARSICGNGEALADSRETRKRGFHIFKHLLPTLARLLRAAIKAFERVDKVDVDTDQIPLGHLSKVIELLFAVVQCGECAYKGNQALSRPIKQAVHKGITLNLRDLHSTLIAKYTTELQRQEEQQRNEELEREMSAREEERERQSQWRKLELHNQDKWKRMNKARFDVSFNTSNIKKLKHLRSCGMHLVQTDGDGQPYLPTSLRDMRGEWSMLEIEALEASLRRHVDTPAPLRSMVFEKLFAEQCPFRKPLADKNVLEIVIKSNELKNFYIQRSRERGIPLAGWVNKIPRWMDPPAPEHDNGSSAEDAIEID
jgi:hypothetical protein